MAWTRERLENVVRERLGGPKLVVVANREPYIHAYDGDEIRCMRPASGLTTALDPVMRACGGVWVAHGSGDADRAVVDEHDRVARAAGRPDLHPAPRLADARRRSRATTTASPTKPCGRCATSPTPGRRSTPATGSSTGGQPEVRRGRPRGGRTASRPSCSCRTTTSPCCRGCSRTPGRTWSWCSSGTSPGRTARSSASARGRRRSSTGCSATTCSSFHIQYHCNNFLDTVDRALEAKVDREQFAVTRGGRTTMRPAVSDQHRPRAGAVVRCPRRLGDSGERRLRKQLAARETSSCSSAWIASTTPRAFPSGSRPSIAC